jgi:hypothetical protein
LSSPPDGIPDELEEAWRSLTSGSDGRKLRHHLESIRGTVALMRGMEERLQGDFGGIKPDAVDDSKRTANRSALVTSLQAHSLSFAAISREFSRLSADAQGAVQKVLGWIADRLVRLLTTFAEHLGLENWSVAAQLATFPPGATFTFTLTFN